MRHLTDEELDRYLLGRGGAASVDGVEEHLLTCQSCRAALLHEEASIMAFRDAAADLERRAAQPAWPWWRLPVPVLGAVAAACLGVVVLMHNDRAPVGVSDVALFATRGIDGHAVVPYGTALKLRLDVSSLDEEAHRYAIEVVHSDGGKGWSGTVERTGDSATVSIAKAFRPGRYWVRVNSMSGEPLREFQLDIRR